MEKIGTLDRRITVQARSVENDQFSEAVETYTTAFECWAAVEYPASTSGEEYKGGLQTELNKVIFTIHWRTGVTTRHRIVYQGDNYDIDAIAEEGRRTYLKITAIRKK